MSIFKKKNKTRAPQWYLSRTNQPVLNYNVYYMKKSEVLLYSLLAFTAGALAGYLFYGGLGKDEFGYATRLTYILNIAISVIAGLIAVKIFLPIRTEQIKLKRKSALNAQFRDMLDGLTTALSSGNNVMDSFIIVRDDLAIQYDESAFILQELNVIVTGLQNNVNIEDLLHDLGERSGIVDIASFADVFEVSYRKGGNIRDVIINTRSVLSDKLLVGDEIETAVTSSKTEQNLMLVMPVALVGMIKMSSPEFASNFATPAGVIATTIAIACFIAAYYLGKRILDIDV